MSKKKDISNLENFEFKPSKKVWDNLSTKLNEQAIPNNNEADSLENFEFQPSEKVWTKLNTHLENTTIGSSTAQLNFYKYALLSAVAIIVLLSTFIFINNTPQTKPNAQSNQQNQNGLSMGLEGRTQNEISTRANENISSSNTVSEIDTETSLALSSSNNIKKQTQNTNDKALQENLFSNWNNNIEPNNEQSEGGINKKMKGKNLVVETNVNNDETDFLKSVSQNKSLFTPSFSLLNNKSDNAFTNSIQEKTNIPFEIANSTQNATDKLSNTNTETSKNQLLAEDKSDKIFNSNQNSIAIIPTITLENSIENWKNISLVKRKNTATNFTANSNKFKAKTNTFSLTYEIGKWQSTAVNNIEISQAIMQQISAQQWWQINKYLSFGTGVSRLVYSSSQNQTISFNFDGKSFDDVNMVSALANNEIRAYLPQSIGIGAGSSIDYDISTNEKAVYYTIPANLQLGFNFGKLNLHTQLGINTAYLAKHSINLPATEQRLDRVEIQNSTINKFNIFGNTRLGLGYNISKKTNIQLHGIFSKSMLNTNSSFTNKPNTFGGGISVLYKL